MKLLLLLLLLLTATPSTDTDALSGLKVPEGFLLRGWQHGGKEPLRVSLNSFSIYFHFFTRHFYLSYISNSPTGLEETKTDNKHASLLSPEHHPCVKTSSHTVMETRRGGCAQGSLSTFLHSLVPPLPVMKTALHEIPANWQTGSGSSAAVVLTQPQKGLKGWPRPLTRFRQQRCACFHAKHLQIHCCRSFASWGNGWI